MPQADTTGLARTRRLPTPRHVLAALFRSLSAIPLNDAAADGAANTAEDTTIPNPLRRVPTRLRPLFATLHVLFPALLLPALDLLDRRRVVRWVRPTSETAAAAAAPTTATTVPLYQILGETPHVVHVRAWHCTCAYFALRAGEAVATGGHGGGDDDDDDDSDDDLFFSTPPCCHLLACLLAEAWPAGLHGWVVDGVEAAGGSNTGHATPEMLAGVAAGVI